MAPVLEKDKPCEGTKKATKQYRFISPAGTFIVPLSRDEKAGHMTNPFPIEFGRLEIKKPNGSTDMMTQLYVFEDDTFLPKHGKHLVGQNILDFLLTHPQYGGTVNAKTKKDMSIVRFYQDTDFEVDAKEETKSAKLEGRVKELEKELKQANKEIVALSKKGE